MKKGLQAGFFAGFTGIVGMLLFGRDASAYIDPSVMTYVIQIVAGVVVAVGAVAGIYFRQLKRKVDKTFGIDENRNKEVESDEILVDDQK